MNYIALLYVVIGAMFVGVMSHLRKSYQIKNGVGFLSVTMFSFLVSSVAAVAGFIIGAEIKLEALTFLFSLLYAIISTVTASLCILGTSYGNVSILILFATLGSLILPSLFGIISAPEENRLGLFKVIGFILAFICIGLNFADKKSSDKEKSNKKFNLFCITVFFTNGSALIIYNLENKYCKDYPYFSFVTEFMLISAIILLIMAVIYTFKNKVDIKSEIVPIFKPKSMALVIGYAIFFFSSEVLSVRCAGLLPIIVQAPVSFSVPIIVTAIIDFLLYRVLPSKKNFLQMTLALICAVCFVLG